MIMKDEEFKFRLSAAEKSMLKEKAGRAGISQSEFLRKCIWEEKLQEYNPVVIQYLKDLINEVNAAGVNINQIVHNVNMHKYSEYEKKKLFVMQQEILKKLTDFTERFYG